MTKRVFIIDDDADFVQLAEWILAEDDLLVSSATCPDHAFQTLLGSAEDEPEVILCDLHMPFADDETRESFIESFEVGLETIRELRWVYPGAKIVALSSAPRMDLVRIAPQIHPVPLFSKPTETRALRELLRGLAHGVEDEPIAH